MAGEMGKMLVARQQNDPSKSSNSLSGMISTLVPTLILAVVFVVLFLLLRTRQKRIYQPRTYLGALKEEQKTPKPKDSMFGWISDFIHIRDEYVLNHHSIDAYFYLRFFRNMVFICLVGWPLTWAVLMPVYATASGGQAQFDRLSFSNVLPESDGPRLFATVFVAWVFLGFVMFVIGRESIHYVQVKQAFSLLPGVASRISTRTVLFTNVPNEYLTLAKIRETLPNVKHIWIAMDTKELDKSVEDRDKTALKLEGAEVALSRNANKNRLKALKKNPKRSSEPASTWLDDKKRPTHKLKFLIGKKVDTINWSRSHLAEVIPKVNKEQASHIEGNGKRNSAVFVEFNSVGAAEAAFHGTNSKLPKKFKPRTVGTGPKEIIWKNLNIGEAQRKIRTLIAIGIISAMIIFWVPITAFIGAVSNINSIADPDGFAPWLGFILQIPGPILGIVTGLLPTILLAVCLILVPIIMRLLFKLAGAATLAEVELKTQTWYFVFQVIQVFLVTTLASGAVSSAQAIADQPSEAPNLLATSLPKASNFYINYFVLFGLAAASKTLFNVAALALYIILGKLLDKTPRKMYNRYTKLPTIGWGSIYPQFTLLGCIAITYSCISPLILGFAAVGLFLLYIAHRYNVIYANDALPINTNGRSFAKAMNQLTTGVYLSEVCLIGLFSIATASTTIAAAPLALMIAFLVITAVFHFLLNRTISSMEKNVSRDASTTTDVEKLDGAPRTDNGHAAAGAPSSTAINGKPVSFLVRLLRPPPLPAFDAFLSTPLPEYTADERLLAYLNPAITTPAPIIWIARDSMGISEREKVETSKYLPCTDDYAWFEEKKGKLVTGWTGNEDKEGLDWAHLAPIHEKTVIYSSGEA